VVFVAAGVESGSCGGAVFPELGERIAVAQAVGAQLEHVLATRFAPQLLGSLNSEFNSLMVDSMWLLVMGSP